MCSFAISKVKFILLLLKTIFENSPLKLCSDLEIHKFLEMYSVYMFSLFELATRNLKSIPHKNGWLNGMKRSVANIKLASGMAIKS